ncbi:Yip1 family protein, partial [Klebsiella pneumoniae]
MNHVWGLFAHPNREMSVIKSENETISHHYTHHVLLMAAVPVICAFIGTTQLGWNFGDGTVIKLSMLTGLALAVLFYAVMLAGVAIMGRVIWWMARQYPQQPSLKRCMVFAGYVATPLFLSGIVALYPLVWLCALVGTIALFYTGYLLYLGIPTFLSINREEGLSFASST